MIISYKHSWLISLIAGLSIGSVNASAEANVSLFADNHINSTQNSAAVNVPESIQPPDSEAYLFGVRASGYQIYRCEANAEGRYVWALKAPDANLYNFQGATIGSHYAGPAWQANDGSHIVGQLEGKIASPNDANAVAWLLVKVKAWGGNGLFNPVTYINRVDTEGGQTPQNTCNAARFGDEYRARYSAVYFFYGRP